MTRNTNTNGPTRRTLLALGAMGMSSGIAGCLGDDGNGTDTDDDTDTGGEHTEADIQSEDDDEGGTGDDDETDESEDEADDGETAEEKEYDLTCRTFDPTSLEMVESEHEHRPPWVVHDTGPDGHQLLSFEEEEHAETAIEAIQVYGFDTQCVINWGYSAMHYWLREDEAVSVSEGTVDNVDCHAFDRSSLEIEAVEDGWALTDGSDRITSKAQGETFDFEEDVEATLETIHTYEFDRQCTIGPADFGLQYWLTE